MSRASKRKWKKRGMTLFVLIVTLVLILPFLWMISTSFKQPDEVFSSIPRWLPRDANFRNYLSIWQRRYFTDYFLNSLIVSGFTMGIALIVAMFT